MRYIDIANTVLSIVFLLMCFYQLVYIPIGIFYKHKPKENAKFHKYACLVCARNESVVIANLIDSIKTQNYDEKLVTVFVLADNCTDDTADVARAHGAVVYERHDTAKVGKSFALAALLSHIKRDYNSDFDGFFVFDADNTLDKNFIKNMNRVFDDGHDIVTSYRNSVNYGDNWISAGYGLWFLRESKYLSLPRTAINASCAVSGTGFLFSKSVRDDMGGWNFNTLVEDIEFSIHHISNGRKIAMAPDAVLYDEQPTTFSQSWRQRMRWSKGYLQVFEKYWKKMFSGMFKSFALYDMTMSIAPIFVLSILGLLINFVAAVMLFARGDIGGAVYHLFNTVIKIYVSLFVFGAVTTVTEWKNINTSPVKKVLYAFTFPLFMMTYIPIAIKAVFTKKVEWKPIYHVGGKQNMKKQKENATVINK